MTTRIVLAVVAVLTLSTAGWMAIKSPSSLPPEELAAFYETPLPTPDGPLRVFHLGHSLVGRDMPAMLAQLAGHEHASQLGWGTPLKAHWEPDEVISGFETENAHAHYEDAKSALENGAYDVFVLTEMLEIEAAVDHFDAPVYLEKWVSAARDGNPEIRTYLYESWHALDDAQGWMNRLDADPDRYWEGVLIAQAMAAQDGTDPIYVIPAGRVMAEFVRRLEATDGIDGATSREDLFAQFEDGSLDPVHVNDLGAYLVALTHYAVLYHQSPEGLPAQLDLADGSPADAPGPELAALMQRTVWDVVSRLPVTGVPKN